MQTIAAYLFLKAWQKHNWGDSWLASDRYKDDNAGHVGLLGPLLRPWRYKHHVMAPIHSLLLPANILIIVGGVMISNDYDVKDQQNLTAATDQGHTAKLLRSIGSGIFLAVAIFFNFCVLKTVRSKENSSRGTHPTLVILVIVGLFLIVRGVFGLLQSALYSVSTIDRSSSPSNETDQQHSSSLSFRISTLRTIQLLASPTSTSPSSTA